MDDLDLPSILLILSMVLQIILQGFFSAMKVAFFRFKNPQLTDIKEDNENHYKTVTSLKEDQDLLAIVFNFWYLFFSGGALVNATILAISWNEDGGSIWVGGGIVLFTLVLLIIGGEISAKSYAVHHTTQIIKSHLWLFVFRLFFWLSYPVTLPLHKLMNGLIDYFGDRSRSPFVIAEEIRSLKNENTEKDPYFEQEEREMIKGIIEFGDTIVRETMVPRIDMILVDINSDNPIEAVMTQISEWGHSRIPFFENTVDNIIGILYAKDLLLQLQSDQKIGDVRKLLREAYFIPESKKISDLLREFREHKIHIAIVVDEYGGTAGLITLEDVIEEIIGEIFDEYDIETHRFRKVDERTFLVDAIMDIDELNENTGLDLPISEDYETLGGFIFDRLGRVPDPQDVVTYERYKFEIMSVIGHRIKQIKITLLPNEEDELVLEQN